MSFIGSSRRPSILWLAVLLALALVPGCTGRTASSSAAPDVITVIAGSAGVNLNPYTNVLSSRQIGALLFRGMFGVDDEGMPTPDLAVEVPTVANGGVSAGGTEITYQIDEAAEWADGTPLTAHDVVFTWSLIESGVLALDPRGTDNVVSVVALDDHTVRLTLVEPDAPFAWSFVPYVLPRHLLSESSDMLSDDFWVHPVGSRGYRVDRHIKATQVDIVSADGTSPTIRVVFADTDAAARSVWDTQDVCVWLDPPVGPTGSERSDTVPGARWQAFVMNMEEGHPTADLAVRQAFAQVATTTVSPGSEGPYGLPVSDPAVDDTIVSDALRSAGWRLQSDGLRYRAGERLVIDVIFNPISAEEGNRIEYDMDIARYGGKIEPYPTFEYTDLPGESPLVSGIFDVALVEFPIGIPYGHFWPYVSQDVPSAENPFGLNVSRVADAELDGYAGAMREAQDTTELRSAVAGAWSRLEELRVVLWDVRLDQTVLYKGVEGVRAQSFEELALGACDEWTIGGAGSSGD